MNNCIYFSRSNLVTACSLIYGKLYSKLLWNTRIPVMCDIKLHAKQGDNSLLRCAKNSLFLYLVDARSECSQIVELVSSAPELGRPNG